MNKIEVDIRGNQTTSFGVALRELRDDLGVSLAVLADRTHYSVSHLSNVEHGTRPPTLDLAAACDEALASGRRLQHLQQLLTAPDSGMSPPAARPVQLPAASGPFIGRAHPLAELDRTLATGDSNRLTVIHGPAGIGKTTLARHWAHQATTHFPDGILYIDLHGDDTPVEPAEVLLSWIRTISRNPAAALPETVTQRAALWRSLVYTKHLLLVLDNAAALDQLRPLLPGGTTNAVLITSRTALLDLAVHDGAHFIALEPFTPDEAAATLRAVVGEQVDTDPQAVAVITARCAYQPLALRRAAVRILGDPSLTLAELAADLTVEHARSRNTATHDDSGAPWSHRPVEDDIHKPSVSRVYDYFLGGAANFAADREFAQQAEAIIPDLHHLAAQPTVPGQGHPVLRPPRYRPIPRSRLRPGADRQHPRHRPHDQPRGAGDVHRQRSRHRRSRPRSRPKRPRPRRPAR